MPNLNRVLIAVLVFSIIFTLAEFVFMHSIITTQKTPEVSARVYGQMQFCLNKPPRLNVTCNLTVYEDDELYCLANATDDNFDYIFYSSYFITSQWLFDITPSGVINFTPNSTQVGNHTFSITAYDGSGCSNNANTYPYFLEVINKNDPPILVSPIPNQTWNQDTTLVAFDLDDYFWDPDGDVLNYTIAPYSIEGITVDIDGSTHVVTFTPTTGWYGTRSLIFFAWDPYNANASSNTVNLEVIQTVFSQPAGTVSGGSSGGGGSSGTVPLCVPQWYCRPWGPCEPDGYRRRECYDLNNCTTEFGKPNVTEPCEFISTCFDGFLGPGEEEVDCGGPCPPCGNCYDVKCNNNEDCTKGLTNIPDCGGPCQPCDTLPQETCYDSICNNGEDCTLGVTEIPDCGGPCQACPYEERPAIAGGLNWWLLIFLIMLAILLVYTANRAHPLLKQFLLGRKKKYYEERLMLEAKISESIFESLKKLEEMLGKEDIERLIVIFSGIVRKYFKSLFNLKYEFTYEELMYEIKTVGISPTFQHVLKSFFERSTEVEFSGKAVAVEEMRAMIAEFRHILSLTSPTKNDDTPQAPHSIKHTPVDQIFSQISDIENLLKEDRLNEAYFNYLRAVAAFKTLNDKDKKKVHGFLTRVFEEIKLAREKFEFEHAK